MAASIDWTVENVRLTLFNENFASLKIEEVWQSLFKTSPENPNRNQQQSIAEGPYKNFRCLLSLSQANEAITGDSNTQILQIAFTPEPQEGAFASLGAWNVVEDDLLQLLTNWLSAFPIDAKRLAAGLVLVADSESENESSQILKPLLSATKWNDDDRDIIFQFNRRVKSANVDELLLNRVANFSSAKQVLLNFSSSVPFRPTGGFNQPFDRTIVKSRYVARLSLDLSTPEERDTLLPKDQLANIYKELVQIASNIKEKGDQG